MYNKNIVLKYAVGKFCSVKMFLKGMEYTEEYLGWLRVDKPASDSPTFVLYATNGEIYRMKASNIERIYLEKEHCVLPKTRVKYPTAEALGAAVRKKRGFTDKYWKMMEEYARKLDDLHISNRDDCYDWGGPIDYLRTMLEFMRDYYKLGENVWAMERRDEDPKRYKNVPTRLESLNMAIAEYEAWQHCEDKYFKWIPDNPEKPYETSLKEDGSVDFKGHFKYLYRSKRKTYRRFNKEYAKHREAFFALIAKYIEEWWD